MIAHNIKGRVDSPTLKLRNERMSEEFKETPIIYMGRQETADYKIGAVYITVDAYRKCETVEQVRANSSIFTAKKESDLPRAIGVVYLANITIDDSGAIQRMRGHPKFVTTEDDAVHIRKDWIARWQAHDAAARVAARSRKTLEKLAKDSHVEKSLLNLRMQYGQTDKIGKLALEVALLSMLRS